MKIANSRMRGKGKFSSLFVSQYFRHTDDLLTRFPRIHPDSDLMASYRDCKRKFKARGDYLPVPVLLND